MEFGIGEEGIGDCGEENWDSMGEMDGRRDGKDVWIGNWIMRLSWLQSMHKQNKQ
jgi:hypothetical protein